jgi:hypothetical protein
MSEIFKRVRKLVDETCAGNAREFSRRSQIPYGTLQGYFRNTLPKAEHISRMVMNAGVNANWLLTGKGNMLLSDTQETAGAEEIKTQLDTGTLSAIIEWLEERLKKEKKVLPPDKKAAFVALAYEYFCQPEEKGEEKEINEKAITQLFKLVA